MNNWLRKKSKYLYILVNKSSQHEKILNSTKSSITKQHCFPEKRTRYICHDTFYDYDTNLQLQWVDVKARQDSWSHEVVYHWRRCGFRLWIQSPLTRTRPATRCSPPARVLWRHAVWPAPTSTWTTLREAWIARWVPLAAATAARTKPRGHHNPPHSPLPAGNPPTLASISSWTPPSGNIPPSFWILRPRFSFFVLRLNEFFLFAI